MSCNGCVVVIDDDAEIREALREAIVGWGCTVVTAGDGVQALEVLARCPTPCLVLLDLNMPRLDGEGFLRRLRGGAWHTDVPVVSMTAERHRGIPEMATAHLDKPFTLDALQRIVSHRCKNRPSLVGSGAQKP